MADEHRPWAIIKDSDPLQPHCVVDIVPAINNAICPTEEYAIRDFISVCRVQMAPVTQAPHIAIDEIMGDSDEFNQTRALAARRIPYLPNFSKMAARTIDPATGASTWALGNHKWVMNNGIFTINAIIVINHHKGIADCTGVDHVIKDIDKCKFFWYIHNILIKSGKEAVIVYNIKYIPAWSRSGWYPHPNTKRRVGIREDSNKI